jgi:hypothetical protein
LQAGENVIQLRSDAAASLHYVVSSKLLLPQREIAVQGVSIRRQYLDSNNRRSKILWKAS